MKRLSFIILFFLLACKSAVNVKSSRIDSSSKESNQASIPLPSHSNTPNLRVVDTLYFDSSKLPKNLLLYKASDDSIYLRLNRSDIFNFHTTDVVPMSDQNDNANSIVVFNYKDDNNFNFAINIDDSLIYNQSLFYVYQCANGKISSVPFSGSENTYDDLVLKGFALVNPKTSSIYGGTLYLRSGRSGTGQPTCEIDRYDWDNTSSKMIQKGWKDINVEDFSKDPSIVIDSLSHVAD
jgi:hypothetical protein